ncbi:hypothetical protein QTP70_015690 [Hemibagrus guttatus]|uniref:Uncharacterized protein n=1 Tax=Hemibagrus guttatus TaxID=175788 RepID=A0AAE0QBL2_9TELE|nr:hypothetical protein QTP70_015690 [Hemibagrus guttatus]
MYLGSTVQSNGECGKEVKKQVQAAWNGWRKVWGVLCDQKISARIKGKVYRTVVRPAMLYGLETVSLRKRQESELEVAELKMLTFSLGVTRLDRIRNEYIRGTAHVGRLGDKVREARLRWFGHVQRRENSSLALYEAFTELTVNKSSLLFISSHLYASSPALHSIFSSYAGWRQRNTFGLFPLDELYYSTELSDYEDDDHDSAQQEEAQDGGDEHEVISISDGHQKYGVTQVNINAAFTRTVTKQPETVGDFQ